MQLNIQFNGVNISFNTILEKSILNIIKAYKTSKIQSRFQKEMQTFLKWVWNEFERVLNTTKS